jgi:hypothetical protein
MGAFCVPEGDTASAALLTAPRPYSIRGPLLLLALRRLMLQGALRVAILAVTTFGVMGFLSLVAASSQAPEPTLASAKEPSRSCMPSRCRAKVETGLRDNKR